MRPERSETKDIMSVEQIGNLISGVGNHEAKAITLILMRDGGIYDGKELSRKILNSQGNNREWEISRRAVDNYCSHSLAPNDLITEVVSGGNLVTFSYSITESGRKLGVPLAGLLLDFSQRHNIPLNLLFGSSISVSKKRAPITTLKILYELIASPTLPIRESDFEKRISERINVISQNLNRLLKLELIQYKAIKVNEPYSLYKLSDDIPKGELPIYSTSPTLTKSIFDILKKHPDQYLTREDLYDLLPAEHKNERSKISFLARITDILSLFNKHKYVTTEGFHYDKQSEINITDEQRAVLTELLGIVYKFQNLDEETLEKGRKLAEEIISDPIKVSSLLNRAKEASSHANASPQEETQKNILVVILFNPGITNKEIQHFLETEFGKKLQINRIAELSSYLANLNLVRAEKEGALNRFYPNG